ncbi:NADH-dependent flavin oxidoreductase nadA [Lasiodiplodia theobromae]|uniref:NADH-dependent flavin oxidoreductase nadA n=1 Tax=Lasiodiplodia theobromae TaxID=45133 RepID=A0A5N5CZT8_9PEZI|nr:NADH-dependent flavin oxidoreductase nadA [Lasiodiplodia theobromae]
MPFTRFISKNSEGAHRLAEQLDFHFSGRTMKNRLMKAAMAEQLATWDPDSAENSGIPTKELIELYRRWGQGANNWGMIVTGNISISYESIAIPGDAIITQDAPFSGPRFEAFKELASVAKANGSLIVGQLNHPGRQQQAKYARGREVIAPSAIQLGARAHFPLIPSSPSASHALLTRPPPPNTAPKSLMTFAKPREATQTDITTVINSFAHAAAFLAAAGFDGIELHGAHGYLIAQFLSPSTNLRTDAYGGSSLRNRMRLLLEIGAAIRARVSPTFVVGVKLNSVEFQAGGLTPDEAAELCRALQQQAGAGFDFVELSGGTLETVDDMRWEKPSTAAREAFFLEFAKQIAPALGTPAERKTKLFVTGGLRTVGGMLAALESGCDGVGLGRPAAQEPGFAGDVVEGRVQAAVRAVPPFDLGSNLGIPLVMAAVQMRQIGQGKEPFDGSDEDRVAEFQRALGEWFKATAASQDSLSQHGYFDF